MSTKAQQYPFGASTAILPNPNLDLTTLQAIHDYAQIQSTADDNIIQLTITAFSQEFLRLTGSGPMDGSMPEQSLFVAPQYFDEWYDGSGTERQFVRNWPIYGARGQLLPDGSPIPQCTPTQIGLPNIFINGQTIPFSVNTPGQNNTPTNGVVVDGSGRSFVIRTPGYGSLVTPNVSRGFQAAATFLGTCYAFFNGTQNVEAQYWAGFFDVPLDIVRIATQIVAINYKRASWIDQGSKTLSAGGGASNTTRYRDWRIPPECEHVIDYYARRAIV